jgi:WD40 repeat protein
MSPHKRRIALFLLLVLVAPSAFAAPGDEPPAAVAPKPLRFSERGRVALFLGFSADGKTLAYGLWPYPDQRAEGAAVLWDVAAGKELRRIDVTPLGGALSPDGRTLALRVDDPSVGLWDTGTGKKLFTCEESRQSPCPSQFAFLPDSRTLAGSFWNNDVHLWDATNGKLLRRFGADRGGVEFFSLSADGKRILAEHKAVRIEPYDPQKHQGQLPRGGLVNVVEVTSRLWDVDTGKELALLGGPRDTSAQSKYYGLWGGFSHTAGTQEHGYQVRLSPGGKPFFAPGPGNPPFLVRVDQREYAVTLLDAAGKELRRLEGTPNRPVDEVVFSPDGRSLAVVGSNQGPPEGNVLLVYDVSDLVEQERARVAKLYAGDVDRLWADLGGTDSAKATGAFRVLEALPRADALAFLKERVPLVVVPGTERVARLIADLDDDAFAVREKARAELHALGGEAEPALREALKGKPSLEQARRVERLLEELKAHPVSGETLRGLWVVEYLERQPTPEARELLRPLAKGAAGAWVTEEAKAALQRTGK